VIFERDRGPADGLNKGFARASGDIFGFLNADDVLLPGAAAAAISFFAKNPDVDVVSGHSLIIDKSDRTLRKSYSDRFSLFRSAYGACILMQQSTFFRVEAFRRAGGFAVGNRVAWDGELFVDMALSGARFALVDEFWSSFRLHDASITGAKKFDSLMRDYELQLFRKIMHRDIAWFDLPVRFLMRVVKHALNTRGLIERMVRGPIYGRSAIAS
jgi:glycosyltransferase involved in cell wall biosynthesis